MMFAVLAGVFYGAFLAMTRAVAGQYRPRFLLLTQLVYAALALLPLALLVGAPALTPWLAALFTLSALASAATSKVVKVIGKSRRMRPLASSWLKLRRIFCT